jgi:predicted nucleotidyltransferase
MIDSSGALAPSGRFLLRIEPGLHDALREAAAAAGLSLNDFCARKLAATGGVTNRAASDVVTRAAEVCGSALIAVAAFGSWARDEQAQDSDVDVLIVLDRPIPITRGLYAAWDASATDLFWDGRPVEPHFAHLPDRHAPLSGLWAEVALEGVVLFDRGFTLSKQLVEVRRRVIGGELTRRVAHGQPYWVRSA